MKYYKAEYDCISAFYAGKKAARSKVHLMQHIDEGLAILEVLGADEKTKAAFCLHPIVQNDEEIDVNWSPAFELAVEYKYYANRYLCRPENDWICTVEQLYAFLAKEKGHPSFECKQMLLADKLQNKKDFMQFHYNSHARSEQLKKYFDLWIHYLAGP